MTNAPQKKTDQADWDPAEVICALRMKGITLSALAKQHGLAESSSLSAALTRSLPKNEQRIADALGIHPKTIWPSRYNSDGTRRPQGFHALHSKVSPLARNSNAIAADSRSRKSA